MKNVLLLLPLFLFNFNGMAQVGPLTNICLVTVDTTFTHNVVVWERGSQTSANPIDSIKIYRSKLLGGDTLVGSVHWDSVSQFRDYSADPNLRPYRYRISGVDDQGDEGSKSLPHQTIHFAILEQGDSIRLRWTKYMGQSINYYKQYVYIYNVDYNNNDLDKHYYKNVPVFQCNDNTNNYENSILDKNMSRYLSNIEYQKEKFYLVILRL